jgi:putative phage-type endonuclease
MKRIDIEQGSQEWLKWRKSIITATDAPALLGVSPYATPLKCWQRKLDLIPEQKSNPAMEKGKINEPIAREWFNNKTGLDVQPVCIESELYFPLGASLDGLCKADLHLLEVKCNGMKYHSMAKQGIIPEFHLFQMYHQMLCSDGKIQHAHYLSYQENDPVLISFVPDYKFKEWVKNYLIESNIFWRKVINFDPPTMQDGDYNKISNLEWQITAEKYLSVEKELEDLNLKTKVLQEKKECLRKDLISLANDQNCIGAGIKISKRITKGRVDYENIPELKLINLDNYRKPPTTSWIISKNTMD